MCSDIDGASSEKSNEKHFLDNLSSSEEGQNAFKKFCRTSIIKKKNFPYSVLHHFAA